MYKNKYITLEKIEGIGGLSIGSLKIQGWNRHGIEINQQLYLYSNQIKGVRPYCWTSIVKEINGYIIITENSKYRITAD